MVTKFNGALILAVAVLAVLLLTAHHSPGTVTAKAAPAAPVTTLNTGKVETAIRTSIRLQRNMDAVVRCPSREPQEAGVTFTCTAVTHRLVAPHAAVYTPFAATVQNARGYTTYVGK